MIVYVPDESGSGGVFYDATDKSLSVRANPPMGLGGREALVLDPARPRFESIPACGPDSSRLQVERKVRLVADGRASVSESVELTGYYASSLRTHLKSLEAAQRKGWAQQALAGWLAGSELQSFSAREIKDNEKALALDLVYALPHACERDGSALRCASGPTWERHYLEVEPVNSRRTPFAIEYPLQVTSRTSFEAPEGWKVGSGGAPAHGEDAFGTWSTGSARSGGGLVVSFDAALKRGEFAAERYGAYRELLEQALRSIAQPVRAER
jgi:hypothetical protein